MISHESFMPWGWNLKLEMKVNQFQCYIREKRKSEATLLLIQKFSFGEWFFKDVEGEERIGEAILRGPGSDTSVSSDFKCNYCDS